MGDLKCCYCRGDREGQGMVEVLCKQCGEPASYCPVCYNKLESAQRYGDPDGLPDLFMRGESCPSCAQGAQEEMAGEGVELPPASMIRTPGELPPAVEIPNPVETELALARLSDQVAEMRAVLEQKIDALARDVARLSDALNRAKP